MLKIERVPSVFLANTCRLLVHDLRIRVYASQVAVGGDLNDDNGVVLVLISI